MSGDSHPTQGTQFFIGAGGSPNNFIQVQGFQGFTGPDGKATVIDTTDLDSTAKEKLMGLPDEGNFQLDMKYISGDPGQQELDSARGLRQRRQFKTVIPAAASNPVANPAKTIYFWGYVLGFNLSGAVDGIVKLKADITIDGPKS